MKYAEGTGWEVEATFGKMNRRTLSPQLGGRWGVLGSHSEVEPGGQFMISHLTESTEFQEILEEAFVRKTNFILR